MTQRRSWATSRTHGKRGAVCAAHRLLVLHSCACPRAVLIYGYRDAWDDLPESAQELWAVLGWDEGNWEAGVVATEALPWHDLTMEQQQAALELGWAQDRWDDVSFSFLPFVAGLCDADFFNASTVGRSLIKHKTIMVQARLDGRKLGNR